MGFRELFSLGLIPNDLAFYGEIIGQITGQLLDTYWTLNGLPHQCYFQLIVNKSQVLLKYCLLTLLYILELQTRALVISSVKSTLIHNPENNPFLCDQSTSKKGLWEG